MLSMLPVGEDPPSSLAPSAPSGETTSRHRRYGAFSREFRSTASSAGMRTTLESTPPMGKITPAPGVWPSTNPSLTCLIPSRRPCCLPSTGAFASRSERPHRSSAIRSVAVRVSLRCAAISSASSSAAFSVSASVPLPPGFSVSSGWIRIFRNAFPIPLTNPFTNPTGAASPLPSAPYTLAIFEGDPVGVSNSSSFSPLPG